MAPKLSGHDPTARYAQRNRWVRSRWLAEQDRCASLAHSLAMSWTAGVRNKRALPDGLAKGTDPPLCYRSRSPQEGATTGPSREAFNPSARGCERYPPRAILRKESAPRGGWISCRRDAHELHKLEVSTLSCIPHFPSHRFLSRLARQNRSLSWGRSAVARGKAYERGIDCKSFGQCGYQEPSGESGFPTRSRKGGVDDQPDVAAV